MSIYETTSGRAFANHPDYDGMTGRVTYQNTVTGMTMDGWKVRNTISYVDIGRAAQVDAVDPEAFLDSDGPFKRRATVKHPATELFLVQVHDALRERPLNVGEIAARVGCRVTRVKGLVRNHPDHFVILGRGSSGSLYGIPGQAYAAPLQKRSA